MVLTNVIHNQARTGSPTSVLDSAVLDLTNTTSSVKYNFDTFSNKKIIQLYKTVLSKSLCKVKC